MQSREGQFDLSETRP
nr:unnamed protein product [Callosobruchus chinensis]